MNIWTGLVQSFSTAEGGFAARKLTAFALIVMVGYIHARFVDHSNAIEAIIIDLIGAAFFLGLVTFEQILKFKNGNATPPSTPDPGSTTQ